MTTPSRLALVASLSLLTVAGAGAAPTQLYSHGDPSPAEQYNLELINRARANPTQEGAFLAGLNTPQINAMMSSNNVDRARLQADFANYTAQPPFAFNPQLAAAARYQALDQATHNYQGHISSNGMRSSDRVAAAGYQGGLGAENTYAYSSSSLFAHAAFNVDWGVPSLGHRCSIMTLYYATNNSPAPTSDIFPNREIGISIVPVTTPGFTVGPNVIVQDFGIGATVDPFVVGVVYQDNDGDNFYSEGEGRAGITVTPSVGDCYAVTSASGGYAIPLRNIPAGTNSLTVTFSGGALGSQTITRTLQLVSQTNFGLLNVKADLQLPRDNTPPGGGTAIVPRLLNISTRGTVGTGDNVMIAGFVISGTQPKRVLVRALGPSLAAARVANTLPDPKLTLLNARGAVVLSNDNWKDTQQAEVQVTGLAPSSDAEAAIVATLPAGAYTAMVSGAGSANGVGLVEVYDLEGAAATSVPSTAINLSTRGSVGIGDSVMIAGFVVNAERKVLVRVLGPSLAAVGVSGTLNDPVASLVRADGTQVASLDDWNDGGANAAAVRAAGLVPSDSRECAYVVTLPAGAYTVVVSGKGGGVGNALVEIYDLN